MFIMEIRDGAFMPQTFVWIKSKQLVDMQACDEKGRGLLLVDLRVVQSNNRSWKEQICLLKSKRLFNIWNNSQAFAWPRRLCHNAIIFKSRIAKYGKQGLILR